MSSHCKNAINQTASKLELMKVKKKLLRQAEKEIKKKNKRDKKTDKVGQCLCFICFSFLCSGTGGFLVVWLVPRQAANASNKIKPRRMCSCRQSCHR